MAVVTICSDFGAQENNVCHCFHCFPIYLPWSDGTRCHDLSFFECWVLSQLFHTLLSLLSRDSLVPLHFLPLEWYHLHILGCWYFFHQSSFQLVIHSAQHLLQSKTKKTLTKFWILKQDFRLLYIFLFLFIYFAFRQSLIIRFNFVPERSLNSISTNLHFGLVILSNVPWRGFSLF